MERGTFPEVPKGLDVELDAFLRALRQRIIDKDYQLAKDFKDIHTDLVSLIP